METEKQFVQVVIPDGKEAVWNEQGILQLVDKEHTEEVKPKDITERVKTLYDAQKELESRADKGDDKAKRMIEEYNAVATSKASVDLVAYLQLRIITSALNEGWEPEFNNGEDRWYPYFIFWTKEDIDNMSDEEKDSKKLMLWGDSAHDETIYGSSSSVSISSAGLSEADAIIGSRLTYKTKALATYAGRQFASVYARFYVGDKARDAKPWREFDETARR